MRTLIFFAFTLLLSEISFGQLVYGQKRKTADPGISVNYSSPKEYTVADIEVEGIQFLDNNALISLSGLKVGDKIKIPGDEISQAIKKIWKQGIIGNISIEAVKVEGSQIWLKIFLTEREKKKRRESFLFKLSIENEIVH